MQVILDVNECLNKIELNKKENPNLHGRSCLSISILVTGCGAPTFYKIIPHKTEVDSMFKIVLGDKMKIEILY